MAVLPLADRATDQPCQESGTASVPTSFGPSWVQTPRLRVKIHTAPTCPPLRGSGLTSPGPPTMAVLPSADSATDRPCAASPTASLPTSLSSCWVQTPRRRVKTHAAPLPLSKGPPTMAVSPSADSATDQPCPAFPTALPPTSLSPCWVQTPVAAREDPR